MSYRKPLIGLCLFLVMTTVATWMVYVTLGRRAGGPTNTYTAQFTDVTGLKSGDDVRVAGVRVGRVRLRRGFMVLRFGRLVVGF